MNNACAQRWRFDPLPSLWFLALGWHLEEIHVTWDHLEKKRTRLRTCTKIHQEVLLTEHGDGVAGIKLRRCDLSGDGVWILATASQRSRLKVDLEPSTWRRRQEHQATTPHQHLNFNLKMPILHSFEENKVKYEDKDEVKIKMMGTGMDKESLEHNLYNNDITSSICHNFSPTSNPPIKPKDSGSFWTKVIFDEKKLGSS
ncbi:hypothetical protein Tco_0668895 [Tanacetum coccineum]